MKLIERVEDQVKKGHKGPVGFTEVYRLEDGHTVRYYTDKDGNRAFLDASDPKHVPESAKKGKK